MRVALFCHSLLSCWNHGNVHFLRGVTRELVELGHEVRAFEPEDAWSVENLVRDHGPDALDAPRAVYPHLWPERYDLARLDLDRALDGVDLAIVHEWSDPELVRRLGEHRGRSRSYKLLFHDTHHRLVTDPVAMQRYDLARYDGVLAFGRVLAELYRARGLAERVFVWHEAADHRVFRPRPEVAPECDVVWIGNYGDGERTREIETFLLGPVRELGLSALVYGVRYPAEALDALARAGARFGGWLPNHRVPDAFARARATVHVPRGPYARALPGIPTIRPFEALACGVPLVSAPWDDVEGLFTPGRDYLVARDGAETKRHLAALLADRDHARALAEHGRATVLARHTCAHRARELVAIAAELGVAAAASEVLS